MSTKIYYPDNSYRESAKFHNYSKEYQDFTRDPDAFWRRIASDLLWFEQWDKILVMGTSACPVVHQCKAEYHL